MSGMPLPLSRFGCGMQAVLGDFVNAAERRFVMGTIEVIKRAGTLADIKAIFNGFGNVGFGEHDGVPQRPT